MNEVVKWLESPEGESWSMHFHDQTVNSLVLIKWEEYGNPEEHYHREPVWTTFIPHGVIYAAS